MVRWLSPRGRTRHRRMSGRRSYSAYPPAARLRDRRLPYLVLMMSLVMTGVTAVYSHRIIASQALAESTDHARFIATMKTMAERIEQRLRQFDAALQAGAAMAPGEDSEHAARFATFVRSLDTMPSFRGLGRVEYSARGLASIVEDMVGPGALGVPADGRPPDTTFLVSSAATATGSMPRRFLAIAPTNTVAGPGRGGLVYAPIRVDALIRGALDSASLAGIRLRLYAGLDTNLADLALDSDSTPQPDISVSSYRAGTGIGVFGTNWALMLEAMPGSGRTGDVNPVPTVLGVGLVLSLVLFGLAMARARAQTSAHETAERYDALFNSTPIPMWLYDCETLRIGAVNDAAVAIYGYTREEFLDLSINDLRQSTEIAALHEWLAIAPATYHNAGIWKHRKKNGVILNVEISAHTIRHRGRRCSMVVAHDISDRIRAEAAVVESEERLRQMADHIKEAFFVVDAATDRPLYISPTWADIWGRPLADGYNTRIWFDAIHADDRMALAAGNRATGGSETADSVFRVIRPDSTIRWVRERSYPVRNVAGEVYRVVGVAEDITELRQVEASFAQAQKMDAIGRLAGGVAHDFNNLLTVILGEADQLAGISLPEPGAAGAVQEIQMAGQRAATLTRQLLAFSRRQMIEPTVFDLTDAVVAMSNMCRRLIGENIELITRLSPGTWTALADRGQVEQVLANLVVNARDAMPQGGQVTIATTNVTIDAEQASHMTEIRTGDYVKMTVCDTGTGMTEAVRSRLFEPFFTTKEPGQGTGLGLATCYGIVKQAEGHMAIYSEPGLGTTVSVYLPRGFAGPAEPRLAEPAELPRGNETILLVEDEPAVRRIAARLLRAQGYHVLEAQDAAEAARLNDEHGAEIHLLLTDVVLPGTGGREIAEATRLRRPDIKVLFASGYTDDTILQHRLLHNDVALLQKPFSREAISRKVREVLDAA